MSIWLVVIFTWLIILSVFVFVSKKDYDIQPNANDIIVNSLKVFPIIMTIFLTIIAAFGFIQLQTLFDGKSYVEIIKAKAEDVNTKYSSITVNSDMINKIARDAQDTMGNINSDLGSLKETFSKLEAQSKSLEASTKKNTEDYEKLSNIFNNLAISVEAPLTDRERILLLLLATELNGRNSNIYYNLGYYFHRIGYYKLAYNFLNNDSVRRDFKGNEAYKDMYNDSKGQMAEGKLVGKNDYSKFSETETIINLLIDKGLLLPSDIESTGRYNSGK
jgi:hypothetical protein